MSRIVSGTQSATPFDSLSAARSAAAGLGGGHRRKDGSAETGSSSSNSTASTRPLVSSRRPSDYGTVSLPSRQAMAPPPSPPPPPTTTSPASAPPVANGDIEPTSSTTSFARATNGLTRRVGRLVSRGGQDQRRDVLLPWQLTHTLENKGSVARDHLANERTFLAWLRTSLSLASIGIAITQLFRLPSSTSVTPSDPTTNLTALNSFVRATNAEGTVSMSQELAAIQQLLATQAEHISILQSQVNDPLKYRHLGKPIGGTFIALALLFLVLGSNRYFTVQSALIKEPQSMFPPSRRSVLFSSTCVAAIVIATFAAILAVR